MHRDFRKITYDLRNRETVEDPFLLGSGIMQGWPGGQQLSGCLHGAQVGGREPSFPADACSNCVQQVANMPFAFQAVELGRSFSSRFDLAF